jgi:hypothetical protein
LYFGLGGYWGWPYYGYYGGYPYGYDGYGYDPYYSDPYAYNSYATTPYDNQYSYAPPAGQAQQAPYPQQQQYAPYPQQQYVPAPQANTQQGAVDYYLLAFSDHTIRAAVSYQVDGDTIRWTTREHEQMQAPLSSLDRRFTEQINRDRHVDFRLP